MSHQLVETVRKRVSILYAFLYIDMVCWLLFFSSTVRNNYRFECVCMLDGSDHACVLNSVLRFFFISLFFQSEYVVCYSSNRKSSFKRGSDCQITYIIPVILIQNAIHRIHLMIIEERNFSLDLFSKHKSNL